MEELAVAAAEGCLQLGAADFDAEIDGAASVVHRSLIPPVVLWVRAAG